MDRMGGATARARLAKGVLIASVLALIATSDQPEWNVEDEAREPFRFVAGQARRQVTQATILYRTPRGTWPLSIAHDVHTQQLAPSNVNDVGVDQTVELDARTRRSVANASENAFEVVCEEEHCEGSIQLDFIISWNNAAAPAVDAAVRILADGGTEPDPSQVTLRVSFFGGPDKPMFGCDGKDSSNDLDAPPEQLGVDVTMTAFVPAGDTGVVPGGPAVDASVALPTLFGLDAGL